MDNYIALLGVWLCLDGTENTTTGVGSVAGVYIYVQRAQTKGAVITRGVTERLYLLAAVLTYKAVVVFSESFVFHIVPLWVCFFFSGTKYSKIHRGEIYEKDTWNIGLSLCVYTAGIVR